MKQEDALTTIKLALEAATRKGVYGLQDVVNILDALKVLDPSIVIEEPTEKSV